MPSGRGALRHLVRVRRDRRRAAELLQLALSCSPCWKSSTMTDWALMDAAAAMTACPWRLLEISLNLAVSLPLMSCVMKYCILSRWQNASPSSICVWVGMQQSSRQSGRTRVWVTEKISEGLGGEMPNVGRMRTVNWSASTDSRTCSRCPLVAASVRIFCTFLQNTFASALSECTSAEASMTPAMGRRLAQPTAPSRKPETRPAAAAAGSWLPSHR